MSESWLVAVTAGRWQMNGIAQAREAGLRVLAIDGDPNAEGFKIADRSICHDLAKHDEIVKLLKELDIVRSIRGAVSFCSEIGMELAARIRQELDLPGLQPSNVRRFLDKGIQRSMWLEKNVPGPRFELASTPEQARVAIEKFGFPSVIKPIDSSGSRGVTKLESASDDIADAVSRAFQFSRTSSVIVEAFMEGTEFTVEVFANRGQVQVLAVTEKKKVPGTRGTVACELATPLRPAEVVARIGVTVVKAFEALSYTDGPGHAEAILMNDGSVGLVEVAARGGGFMVFDKLVPAVSGFNIARMTALQAVGVEIADSRIRTDAAVLRFFPSRPGTLNRISGFDEANRIPGVEAAPFVKAGDSFSRAIADGDRMGFILSQDSEPKAALEKANRAESMITFEFAETHA